MKGVGDSFVCKQGGRRIQSPPPTPAPPHHTLPCPPCKARCTILLIEYPNMSESSMSREPFAQTAPPPTPTTKHRGRAPRTNTGHCSSPSVAKAGHTAKITYSNSGGKVTSP